MKTTQDIRRENLGRLLVEREAKKQLAIRLNVTQGRISHLTSGERPISEDVARAIEQAIGLQPYDLDTEPGAKKAGPMTGQDLDLMEAAVRSVIDAAASIHAKVVAEKTANISRLVYEHSKPLGRVDSSFVQQLVRLMR